MTKVEQRVAARVIAVLFLLFAGAAAAHAQAWPARAVRVIVPWPPGGTGDNTARAYSDELGKLLGQPFVIENRAGASATLGTELVARAAPDGYTLLSSAMSPMMLQPHVQKNLGYDPFNSFVPVSMMSTAVSTLGAHPSLGIKSLKELIDLAKREPGKINYGAGALGGATHLRMEYLKQLAGIDLTAIPYSGSGAVMGDFMAGHVTLFFDALVTPMVKSGKIVGLGIADVRRDPDLPDVPTIDEAAKAAGLPGFILSSWQGAWFPKGTSPEIVKKLADAIATVGALPEVQRRLRLGSMSAWTTSPAEMEAQMRQDFATYGKLIASVGIKQE